VAICSRGPEKLHSTGDEIRAAGAECIEIALDLTESGESERAVAETVAAFGGIDILINNASANIDNQPSKFVNATDEQITSRVSGKALATVRCSRAVLPHMQAAGWGRIVNIAGSSARNAFTGRQRSTSGGNSMISGMGNAMIVNFSKMLSTQVAAEGILVNAVLPHITRTDRHPERMKKRAAELGMTEAEAEADFASYTPLGRVMEPEDIAPLVTLLASPINGAITGQTIAVDGGACSGILN
jgi:NAD(P)-dependent dehydrogenase (short-subunit alcohol dehydrogenase family)